MRLVTTLADWDDSGALWTVVRLCPGGSNLRRRRAAWKPGSKRRIVNRWTTISAFYQPL